METFRGKLTEYAELLVRVGVDMQRGQSLVINAPVDEAALVRLITKAAYDAGCRDIYYSWTDNELTRLRYLGAADAAFDEFPSWRADMLDICSREGYSRISIVALEPELFAGIDPSRAAREKTARLKATVMYEKRMNRAEFPWCLAASPTRGWAKLLFPERDEEAAIEALWNIIFASVRVGNGNAVIQWKKHGEELGRRTRRLNSLKLTELHYITGLGTNVTVRLPEGHFWLGGDTRCKRYDRVFFPNIPTEETFTVPHKYGVDGVIVASKPLSLNGNVIEGIRLKLEGGRIVEASAEKNGNILKRELESDEGARYFGEAALVSFDSPINKTGMLFYHTLFDENAVSHFAFGNAYPCVKGADDMSDEELEKAGINVSGTHVDFMVGTVDMLVTGKCANGREVVIMKDGIFAF